MCSEQPLLTIAIPTYNRSKYLKQLLTVLATQLLDEPRVELIISDNASPDDTPSVVESFQRSGLKYRYIRNNTDIGPDRNFLQCFEQAQGKYFWLFGDDDLITPGGIERVVDLLNETTLDMVFCAPYPYEEDYLADLQNVEIRRSTEITEDVIRFVRLANYHGDFIFISSMIINKANLLAYEHPPFESLLETNLVQLSWVFTGLAHFRKGAFLQVGTVAGAAAGSGGGFNAAKVFAVNYSKAISIFIGRGKLARLLLNDQLFLWFSNNWIELRQRSGLLEIDNTEALLRQFFGWNPRHWLVIVPLVKLPLSLARYWKKMLGAVKRLNRIARDL